MSCDFLVHNTHIHTHTHTHTHTHGLTHTHTLRLCRDHANRMADMKRLADAIRAGKGTLKDLEEHMAFVNEYMYKVGHHNESSKQRVAVVFAWVCLT